MEHMNTITPIFEINEEELYEIDKLILDKNYKEWRTREFERKLKNIHDMKSFNNMNHT